MFQLGKMIGSCGSGCRLLWKDPTKQGDGYGTVQRNENPEDSDDSFEDDAFSPDMSDVVFSQPSYPKTIWTEQSAMSSPIVRNNPLANLPNGSFQANKTNNSPIVKKSVPIVKNVSNESPKSSQKQSPSVQTSFERPSPKVGVHSSSYSQVSPKSPKKDTAVDDSIQMVSVV